MPRRIFALFAASTLAVVLASCGGGGTTTVTEKTIMRDTLVAPETLLPDIATNHLFEKPATYRFSVDGDLVGRGLHWHGWGAPRTVAFGTLVERPASGLEDTFSGSVTASAPVKCHGHAYYTRIFPHLPKQADFIPTEPTKLSTPCD
jgi:hypothetical protein